EVVNQYWDDIDYIKLSYSTSNKEDSDISTLLLTKKENPIVFNKFETSEYKIFISYNKFKEYLLDKNIINMGQHINQKRTHIRSYFNLFNDGYGYSVQYDILDLKYHRRRSYKNDFKVWFYE
ncbi:7951_t:CDS:2, partial [Gigaspora margarita]